MNRGWINLLEVCEGGISCYCKRNCFCAFISNVVPRETKRVRRWLNNVLIHLNNYTADRYRVGDVVLLLGKKWVWGLVWNRGVNQLTRGMLGLGLGRTAG